MDNLKASIAAYRAELLMVNQEVDIAKACTILTNVMPSCSSERALILGVLYAAFSLKTKIMPNDLAIKLGDL